MGASGSKKRSKPLQGLQERLLQARGETCGGRCNESGGGYLQSHEGSGREQNSPSCEGQRYQQGDFVNTPWRTPAAEREKELYKQQNMDDVDLDDDDQVGFPVTPRVPLRPMTFKLAVDMSHFIKEKGGLEGLFYSQRRHRILDLYLDKAFTLYPEEFGHNSGLPEKEWKARLKARGIPFS
ncbi:nef protein [Human immunodeficiency virus 2]|uniref:Protein Nef n=1 Tax=Human immunodeficiency virus type 2 subtype A (isolate NIH-Z) TaxID=11719 RepID=NEF_HV2NZ|nr:RecName: Full=Protein Nef; AltName: Full=3'ORF; AltName: Full=Negative factor; Short=F-protein [Human immunodeficiency virus type 2 (ISOLATE NIH-Z)]AAB00762.1 nef protein [Human immunodeficiency virus 2]